MLHYRQIRVTILNHDLVNNDVIDIYDVGGIERANCCAKVMVVDEHRFDLYTEWGLPIEQVFQTGLSERPTLPNYTEGTGRICKSGHVDLRFQA